jgi:hypothetical protein
LPTPASTGPQKGAFWFTTYQGGLNGELFVRLWGNLMRGCRKALHLILDYLPARKIKGVQ